VSPAFNPGVDITYKYARAPRAGVYKAGALV
jgi:hypothetical protein